jgi:hypothetical protein
LRGVTAGAKYELESRPSSRKSVKTEAGKLEKVAARPWGLFEAFRFNGLLPPLTCFAGLRTTAKSWSVQASVPLRPLGSSKGG